MSTAPWEGRWSNPQRHHGMTEPRSGEVAWLLPEGWQAHWRGSLTSVAYKWVA